MNEVDLVVYEVDLVGICCRMNTFIKLVLNEVSKAQTLLLGLKGLMRPAFTFSYDDACVSINSFVAS